MIPIHSAIFRRILIGGAALGSAGLFFHYAIAPLRLHKKDSVRRVEELRQQLDSAQATLRVSKDPEQELEGERTALNRLFGESALNSAMVSFPESVRQHFARFGIPLRVMRLNTIQEMPDLPGYQRVYWSVALPVAETDRKITGLLIAVAELEKQNRFTKVIDFALLPDVEEPRARTVGINLVTLLPK